MKTLFDDLEIETPPWAKDCRSCHHDELGRYDELRHFTSHLPLTCAVCGETEPNRFLAELNHDVNLGASRQNNALLCVSLSLRLNHLSYAKRNDKEPRTDDLKALELGWTVLDDGTQVPPEGWPDASHATKSEFIAARETSSK